MVTTSFDPNTVQGHLPLKSEHLPAGFKALNDLDSRAQAAADRILLSPETQAQKGLQDRQFSHDLNPQTLIDALMPAYRNTCDRLHDLTNEIHEQNRAVGDLRDVKQMIRSLSQELGDKSGEIDLDQVASLKRMLEKCQENYGLVVPQKNKLNKDDITTLLHNIEDCCDNHSDIGDEKRLRFKKMSSDADATLRLMVEMMNVLFELRKYIISNFRSH